MGVLIVAPVMGCMRIEENKQDPLGPMLMNLIRCTGSPRKNLHQIVAYILFFMVGVLQ